MTMYRGPGITHFAPTMTDVDQLFLRVEKCLTVPYVIILLCRTSVNFTHQCWESAGAQWVKTTVTFIAQAKSCQK